MIQRPVSPPGLPTTFGATSPSAAPLRGRVSKRRCGGGIAVCCVASLCVMFLFAEMRTEKLTVSSVGTSSAAGRIQVTTEHDKPEDKEREEERQQVQHGLEGGLQRFDTFEEFLETPRAEGSLNAMPVVRRGDEDVTVPAFIVVGARRGGTSSLYSMLAQHPDVGAILPELYVAGSAGYMAQDPKSYPRAAEWPGDGLETGVPPDVLGKILDEYARPYTLPETREEGTSETKLLTGEASPGYLASALAPYRLKVAMPDVRVVVVLRDPVDRYFSDLRSALCADKESDIDWEDIENAFAMPNASKEYLSTAMLNYSPYDKKCLGEGASAADLWSCQQATRKTHRPLLEGLYAGQVARWLRAFGDSQVKVVDSKTLFASPEKTAAEVAKFLGLTDHQLFEFALDREASCDPRRRSAKVATAYSKRKEAEPQMRKWYADHNDMVTDLLGVDFGWNDRIRSMVVGGGLRG